MFKDKMSTMAIPERVFTLCKLLEKESLSTSELKEKMEPSFLEQKNSYYPFFRAAAEELKLISISDDIVSLVVDSKVIKSYDTFRQYVNNNLELFNNGQFYQVTNAYFGLSGDILKMDKNIANLAPLFAELSGIPVDADAMRAWRFWASFLGFGYLQDMFLIPNASLFLHDLIVQVDFEKKNLYTITEFVEKISPQCNILFPNKSDKTFNYGLSNGLRALEAQNVIKLEHILDQMDMWKLYPMKAISNDSVITHIRIL